MHSDVTVLKLKSNESKPEKKMLLTTLFLWIMKTIASVVAVVELDSIREKGIGCGS